MATSDLLKEGLVYVYCDVTHELEGPLNGVHTRILNRLLDEYPAVDPLTVSIIREVDWDSVSFQARGSRPETKRELEIRKERAKKEALRSKELAEKVEKNERKEFERLKKKYGKSKK